MTYRMLPLSALLVNRANDRHGELENETAAIAWLFNNREQHMRNLAKDIVEKHGVFDAPLVSPEKDKFIVFDGNRRVTCLKLLNHPRKAPTVELQEFFAGLRSKWQGDFPEAIQCQVEPDRDRIDDILYRRHTGSQNGIGQSTWDDRMKANFVVRTGKGSGFNVADEIEKRLAAANMLPGRKKIPRSTLNRLLSAEAFRNRLGFSISKGRFVLTHEEPVVLAALQRVAGDLASKAIVLGDIWDVDGKRGYLDQLESEKLLPTAAQALNKPKAAPASTKPAPVSLTASPAPRPVRRVTLIPNVTYAIAWPGRLQRHHAIWDELQFHLNFADHPNAISVLMRVLLELSIENYITQVSLATVGQNDSLAKRALKSAEDMHTKGKIDQKYLGIFQKLPQFEPLVSMDTLNRYVHSPNFAPSPDHLTALWDTLSDFIVHCLNA